MDPEVSEPYLAIYFDDRGEIHVGGYGEFTLEEIMAILEIARAKIAYRMLQTSGRAPAWEYTRIRRGDP